MLEIRQTVLMRVAADSWSWFKNEWRRENIESRDRLARRGDKLAGHPFRSIALAAIGWGCLMWLTIWRTTDPGALVGCAIASIGFGATMYWLAQLSRRRYRNQGHADRSPT